MPCFSSRYVSIHAPRFREAMRGFTERLTQPPGVSIHAPRFREAMRRWIKRPCLFSTFQSTPPVSGRRCASWTGQTDMPLDVSIHAPRFREAMLACDSIKPIRIIVSIHAPRFREAMHRHILQHGLQSSFNPRPPFPGGDAAESAIGFDKLCCFNPRPPFPGGDALALPARSISTWTFQSTPPVSGRRCMQFHGGFLWKDCFNPRPPFPGGDAQVIPASVAIFVVSIHAPRFREAMHDLLSLAADVQLFQSTPPVSGRRCLTTLQSAPAFQSFNPRPPFPGGDARVAVVSHRPVIVSIHAPRFREAMRKAGWHPCGSPVVSIHAPRFREAMPVR